MKSRLLVFAALVVFVASFTACATKDDDLKRLETQIQQAMQKAEQASKDAAAAKAAVQDSSRYAEQAGAAATRAEDAAKKAEAIFTKALKK